MNPLPHNQILVDDSRTVLQQLPEHSVDCVVTSPPYFRLRNYGTDEQIGLEPSVDDWVDELRLVMSGLARVLKPTGSLWLNLGDSYARGRSDGASAKSLLLGPERLALKLLDDGWTLRNKIVWSKPNPMPTSVRDRLSSTWEVVYCFTRSQHYFYDLDAIRIPHTSTKRTSVRRRRAGPAWSVPASWRAPLTGNNNGLDKLKASGLPGHPLGKNPGDVWIIPTAGYRGAHHAVYPETLARRAIQAGCPDKVCTGCGVPWKRDRHKIIEGRAVIGEVKQNCSCPEGTATRPGLVLDPFMGSGTTAVVAEQLGRDWLGIEVNPEFAEMAMGRIAAAREAATASHGKQTTNKPNERRRHP